METPCVEIIEPTDERWRDALRLCSHDFYHLPEYATLSARHEGAHGAAVLIQSKDCIFLQPLLFRRIPNSDLQDCISPYGYSPPILSHEALHTTRFLRDVALNFNAVLSEMGVVAVIVRGHPLLPQPLPTFELLGTVFHRGVTVYCDLTLSDDELRKQIRADHRRGIRLLNKSGASAQISTFVDVSEFSEIYNETMRRVGATEYYYFHSSYFESLKSALGQALNICTVSIDGECAAAGLFTEIGGIVQYHLSGTREKFMKMYPSKLMLDFVRDWAKQRGNKFLHLGGGCGFKEDTLYEFKSGFSKSRGNYWTWQNVVRPVDYDDLVEANIPLELKRSDYFPLYRLPQEVK